MHADSAMRCGQLLIVPYESNLVGALAGSFAWQARTVRGNDTIMSAATHASPRKSPALHIMLVEDDELLRDHVLVPQLERFGFEITALGLAADLRKHLSNRQPDIVVLDVGLPDRDGFDVTRQLRAEQADIGIVMLTGRGEKADRVRGLSEGADAYLSKPVDMDILAATLYSLARRLRARDRSVPAPSPGEGWRLDANGWCLLSPSGAMVALTKTEGRLLDPFMKRPNQIISRSELIRLFATNVYDFDPHRLDSLIHRLRKKVLSVLGEPLPMNAVHGEGYVLVQV
jgi:DNA-binding response OmpR family regulator